MSSAFTSTSATNASGYVPPEQQVLHFAPQQQARVVWTAQEATAAAVGGAGGNYLGPPRPDNSALPIDYSKYPTKYVEVACKFRKGPDGRTAVGQCLNHGCNMMAEDYRMMCRKTK